MSTLPRISRILLASAFPLIAFGAAPGISKPSKQSKPPIDFSAIKGESNDKDHKDDVHAASLTSAHCDTRHAQSTNGIVSDPEEGGQVSAKGGTTTGWDLKQNPKTLSGGGSSDPEEGGQVTAASKGSKSGRPDIHDIQVSKHVDKSSNNLFMESSASGSGCGSSQH